MFSKISEKFPQNFFDVPINENNKKRPQFSTFSKKFNIVSRKSNQFSYTKIRYPRRLLAARWWKT